MNILKWKGERALTIAAIMTKQKRGGKNSSSVAQRTLPKRVYSDEGNWVREKGETKKIAWGLKRVFSPKIAWKRLKGVRVELSDGDARLPARQRRCSEND